MLLVDQAGALHDERRRVPRDGPPHAVDREADGPEVARPARLPHQPEDRLVAVLLVEVGVDDGAVVEEHLAATAAGPERERAAAPRRREHRDDLRERDARQAAREVAGPRDAGLARPA